MRNSCFCCSIFSFSAENSPDPWLLSTVAWFALLWWCSSSSLWSTMLIFCLYLLVSLQNSLLSLVLLLQLLLNSCMRNLIAGCRMTSILLELKCVFVLMVVQCIMLGLGIWKVGFGFLLLVSSKKWEGRLKIESLLYCSEYYLTELRFWVTIFGN